MSKENNEKLRYSVRGKKQRFFESDGVDELVSICMSISQELWVVKEELAALKNLSIKKGLISNRELQNFKFSKKQLEVLEKENKEFIDRIFFTLRENVEATETDPDEPKSPSVP